MLQPTPVLRLVPAEVNGQEWAQVRERAVRYRSMVPAFLYVATTTRPDIAYACGILCRCLDNPSSRHLDAAEILLAYLMETIEDGITYGGVGSQGKAMEATYSIPPESLCALSDSDWSSAHSITGFIIMLAGGAIAWASKRQPVTSLSSTEAEFYAASSCGQDILALRHFLEGINHVCDEPTPLFIDNRACVSLAQDPGSCKRTKHINRRVWFLCDYQKDGQLKALPIGTHYNTADMFTKPLAKDKFAGHRQRCMNQQ